MRQVQYESDAAYRKDPPGGHLYEYEDMFLRDELREYGI